MLWFLNAQFTLLMIELGTGLPADGIDPFLFLGEVNEWQLVKMCHQGLLELPCCQPVHFWVGAGVGGK